MSMPPSNSVTVSRVTVCITSCVDDIKSLNLGSFLDARLPRARPCPPPRPPGSLCSLTFENHWPKRDLEPLECGCRLLLATQPLPQPLPPPPPTLWTGALAQRAERGRAGAYVWGCCRFKYLSAQLPDVPPETFAGLLTASL